MLDSPTRANSKDFQQRYCNGYGIYITDSQKRVVVWLEAMAGGRLHFRDSAGQEYFVNFDTNASFEFLPSVRGWHQQAHRPVFLSRIPARQYNRGINGNNTTAKVFLVGRWRNIEVDHDLVDSLFGPEYPDLARRFAGFASQQVSFCVLSPYFCLVEGSVFLSDISIGSYTQADSRTTITLTNPIATQELTDLIRRNNLNMEILNGAI